MAVKTQPHKNDPVAKTILAIEGEEVKKPKVLSKGKKRKGNRGNRGNYRRNKVKRLRKELEAPVIKPEPALSSALVASKYNLLS